MERVNIKDLNQAQESELAKQALVRSVHETEQRLKEEGRLVTIRLGSAYISTTSPEKYNV